MKAVQLQSFEGIKSLKLVDTGNRDQLRRSRADSWKVSHRWKRASLCPGVEVAGVVVEAGSGVTQVRVGNSVAALVSSGGYAEFAIAQSNQSGRTRRWPALLIRRFHLSKWPKASRSFLKLIEEKKLRIFANQSFPLSQAPQAFEALLSRKTIGKVVLTP